MRITDEELRDMESEANYDAIGHRSLRRRAFAAAVAKDCAEIARQFSDEFPHGTVGLVAKMIEQRIKERYGVE